MPELDTIAVVLEGPETLGLRRLALKPANATDVVVEIDFSGISTGTERLLYTGRMPPFPGMGYPLVPGYESVGRITEAGPGVQHRIGEHVFVPGASCFKDARGLFGGAARTLIVPETRAVTIGANVGEQGVLIALAATAQHAIAGGAAPDLIVGHGVLGRLLARLVIAGGHAAPTVWETKPARADGASGYSVIHPDADTRRDYRAILDASGDPAILDSLIARLAKGGEIILAGFYDQRIAFGFPMAFMKEARLRIAAEWAPADLAFVQAAIADGRLSLDGLITHRRTATEAPDAYAQAFGEAACLKMILDWSAIS
jgi:3-hydroxyethyl bacteriochlorophyllide a dehydrogenase